MAKEIPRIIPQEEDLRKTVAYNLKFLREKRGLTQAELANIAKIPRTAVGRYEACIRTPTLINILRIAKALDVTPNDLLDDWEEIDF